MIRSFIRLFSVFSISAGLAACGGGSDGGIAATPPPPPPPPAAWQAGIFQPAASFAARCVAPRAGTDPATGQSYPDIGGSRTDENNFLRSYSDETYLWYSEITDRDPGLYDDTLEYFDLLKTTATTSSGADKDKFHFTYDSAD